MITRDLKKCDLVQDLRDAACKRSAGRRLVKHGAAKLNCFLEEDKEKKKMS